MIIPSGTRPDPEPLDFARLQVDRAGQPDPALGLDPLSSGAAGKGCRGLGGVVTAAPVPAPPVRVKRPRSAGPAAGVQPEIIPDRLALLGQRGEQRAATGWNIGESPNRSSRPRSAFRLPLTRRAKKKLSL